MITISAKTTVYHLVEEHPAIKEVLFELGFEQVVVPAMLRSVGRIITLEKACSLRHVSPYFLKNQLAKRGFDLIDIKEKENIHETL